MDVVAILESSPFFSSLNRRILWQIAELAQQKDFQTGDVLIKEGEIGEYCYIITSGKVEIYRQLNQSNKLLIGQAGAGEILGELAILDGLPRSANVVALEPTTTLTISEWDFKAQLQAYPEIALQLLPVIARRLRQAQEQLGKISQNE